MSTLIIESIANRPHLEISGEIALEYKRKGVSPDYAWIGSELGWTEWHEPKILSFFGIKIENRVKNLLNDSECSQIHARDFSFRLSKFKKSSDSVRIITCGSRILGLAEFSQKKTRT